MRVLTVTALSIFILVFLVTGRTVNASHLFKDAFETTQTGRVISAGYGFDVTLYSVVSRTGTTFPILGGKIDLWFDQDGGTGAGSTANLWSIGDEIRVINGTEHIDFAYGNIPASGNESQFQWGTGWINDGSFDAFFQNVFTKGGTLRFEALSGSFEVGGYQLTNRLTLNHSYEVSGGRSIVGAVTVNPSAPVPEPATIALLGIGLVGLAGAEVRRRRKKKAVS